MERIRIHTTMSDVDVLAVEAQYDGIAYERSNDSSRIICTDDPKVAMKVFQMGCQVGYMEYGIHRSVMLGDLRKMSDAQVVQHASNFSEEMRRRFGFTPPNLIVAVSKQWYRRWRGRKFRKNFLLLMSKLREYRIFVYFGKPNLKLSKHLPWATLDALARPIFVLEPGSLFKPDIDAFTTSATKLGIRPQRIGFQMNWLPYNGHFDISRRFHIDTVMTGPV